MLKLQYFGHLMWRSDSLEKTLMLGKIKSRKRRGWQRMRWLDGITNSMDEFEIGVGDGQRSLVCCSPWDYKESDTTEWLNWRLNILKSILNTLINKISVLPFHHEFQKALKNLGQFILESRGKIKYLKVTNTFLKEGLRGAFLPNYWSMKWLTIVDSTVLCNWNSPRE